MQMNMGQRRAVGTCLLVLSVVAALLAALGAYNFARGDGGDGLDAAYTLSAVLATGTCGGWAYYFLHNSSKPRTETPDTPANNP